MLTYLASFVLSVFVQTSLIMPLWEGGLVGDLIFFGHGFLNVLLFLPIHVVLFFVLQILWF